MSKNCYILIVLIVVTIFIKPLSAHNLLGYTSDEVELIDEISDGLENELLSFVELKFLDTNFDLVNEFSLISFIQIAGDFKTSKGYALTLFTPPWRIK